MNIRITDLFETYTGKAANLRETALVSPERIRQLTMEKIHSDQKPVKPIRSKALKITLIAALIATLFMTGALAVGAYITSETQALELARRELQVWRDMGLISADLELDGAHMSISRSEEDPGNGIHWPYRILNPVYAIHHNSEKYTTSVLIDTLTGKITTVSIQAWADEGAEPVPDKELVLPESGETVYYYENFGDIFDPAMTLGEFCAKLSDYWGYDGYSIGKTENEFYGADRPAPSESELLSDCYLPYITVYFDGDQKGVPQYIQVYDLPGGASLMVGIRGHALG